MQYTWYTSSRDFRRFFVVNSAYCNYGSNERYGCDYQPAKKSEQSAKGNQSYDHLNTGGYPSSASIQLGWEARHKTGFKKAIATP